MKLDTFLVLLPGLAVLSAALPSKRYNIIQDQIDKESITTQVSVENNALGTCTCDITKGSCDAYCCCDTECASDILAIWNSNYNEYCAKNYIGAAYKPT